MTDEDTDASDPTTCTFTVDELDIPESFHMDLVVRECSRPVWDGTDSDRCVWHAEGTDKPPDELAATILDGELSAPHACDIDRYPCIIPRGLSAPLETLVPANLLEQVRGACLRAQQFKWEHFVWVPLPRHP